MIGQKVEGFVIFDSMTYHKACIHGYNILEATN